MDDGSTVGNNIVVAHATISLAHKEKYHSVRRSYIIVT